MVVNGIEDTAAIAAMSTLEGYCLNVRKKEKCPRECVLSKIMSEGPYCPFGKVFTAPGDSEFEAFFNSLL